MRGLAASLVFFGGFALPAMAEQDVPEMPAPSISESEAAEPDWFQRFNFNTPGAELSLWETRPSQTFNLAWIQGDRWSLSLDLTSRDEDSLLPREEMMAEAEFRITPRISVGGELSIGSPAGDLNLGTEEFDTSSQLDDQEIEAGIRLRSAFKF